MDTIAKIFEPGKRRTAGAQQRLQQAYEALFSGNGSVQDAEIVLADIATFTGYNLITEPKGATSEELWYNEGRRSVAGRIVKFAALPGEARMQLAEAVRMEVAATNMEQNEL